MVRLRAITEQNIDRTKPPQMRVLRAARAMRSVFPAAPSRIGIEAFSENPATPKTEAAQGNVRGRPTNRPL